MGVGSTALKRRLYQVSRFLIPAAIYAFLLWNLDSQEIREFREQPKHWGLLTVAFVLATSAIFISFVRWWVLVRAFDIPFTLRESMRLGILGYMLNFVAFGSVGGDLFKAILVARDKPGLRPEAIGSVLLDRALGLLGLIFLAWMVLAIVPGNELPTILLGIRNAAGFLAVISIIGLMAVIYAERRFQWLWLRVSMIPLLGPPLSRIILAVLRLRHSPGVLPLLLLMSVVIHSLMAVSFYVVSSGVYGRTPTMQQHFMVVPPGLAAGALPLAPGGLGLQEGAIAGLFNALPNLPDNFSGLLVASVHRLLTLGVAGIGLVYYLVSRPRDFEFASKQSESMGHTESDSNRLTNHRMADGK